MTWPTIAAPSRITGKYLKAQHKAKFETGRSVRGAKHVVALRAWTLFWSAMTQSDLDSLLSAFGTDQGSTFTWTHPLTSTSYTVGYGADQIDFDISGERVNRYEVSVDLEQA